MSVFFIHSSELIMPAIPQQKVRQGLTFFFPPHIKILHQFANSTAEEVSEYAFGPLPPTNIIHILQANTVVFSADMALNVKWIHTGPLCHNPTLNCDTWGFQRLPICAHNYIFECPKRSVGCFGS